MNKAIATLILASLLMSTLPLNVSADETQDIPTNAQATGVHDTLVDAVIQAGLLETLQGDGPFTVFAPTDAAFEAAGVDLSTFTTDEDNQTLANILTYHVVAGSVAAADVTDGMTAATVNGANLSFSVADGVVTVNNAKVTTADVMASNGVIHVIDAVLTPPAAEPAGPTLNIPETAQSTGVHTSLVAALSHAGLVETLQGDGPFTVFAPTDEAFTAAGIDLSAFDTAEENETLSDILLYHVLSGAVPSSDVTDGLTVAMINGDNASFTVTADGVTIEGAGVTTADVTASNGIIHVIDQVLMPPADEPVLPDCDAVVGIAPSGLKYSPATLSISVGDTVCWQWTDSSMAHNVRQVDGEDSTTYTQDGVSSGEAAVTVDFRYTFTEDDTTFYYACEPHMAAGMYGKVIVGDGGATAVVEPTEPVDTSDEDENTPGFVSTTLIVALLGAVLFLQRRQSA
jgi:uncharacterized surface protein with fasciclin (FAS1) repeats